MVVIWTAARQRAEHGRCPARWISSLSCWKPRATSPRATSEPTGTPGGACTSRPCSSGGDAPALEQLHQRDAARAGGIADGGRGEHGALAALPRWRRRGAARRPAPRRRRRSRTRSTRLPATHVAAGDQLVDGVGGEHHEVEGFARLHAPGGIDAADGFDLRPGWPRALLVRLRQSASTWRVAMDEMPRERGCHGAHCGRAPRAAPSRGAPLAAIAIRHNCSASYTSRMDLKQLEYFVRVAELGSFTRAAIELDVAQPALSRQVRLLEVGAAPEPAGAQRPRRGAHRSRQAAAGARARHPAPGASAPAKTWAACAAGWPAGWPSGLPNSVARVLTVPLTRAFREALPRGAAVDQRGPVQRPAGGPGQRPPRHRRALQRPALARAGPERRCWRRNWCWCGASARAARGPAARAA